MTEVDIDLISHDILNAYAVIVNPKTPHRIRLEAQNAIDYFKETSALCSNVGFYLVDQKNSPDIQTFGLQLVENVVNHQWDTTETTKKSLIRSLAMEKLINGLGPVNDVKMLPNKEFLSQIIMQLIKHDWPARWPDLLSELSVACSKGESQTELVLLITVQLVEFVEFLNTVHPNHELKHIYLAFLNNVKIVYGYLERILLQYTYDYRESISKSIEYTNVCTRIIDLSLSILNCTFKWIPSKHLKYGKGKLMQLVCDLIIEKPFMNKAAEGLCLIANRQGPLQDLSLLLIIFDEDQILNMLEATRAGPSGTDLTAIKNNHDFLKNIVDVLNGMTKALFAVWHQPTDRPLHFEIFLQCFFELLRHESLIINQGAIITWNSILENKQIVKDPVLLSRIPQVFDIIANKCRVLGYPTKIVGTARITNITYLYIEFSCQDEFHIFYKSFRVDLFKGIELLTKIQPLVSFSLCEEWLYTRISEAASEANFDICNTADPIYKEWDAISEIAATVLKCLASSSERPKRKSAFRLLQECLTVYTKSPLIELSLVKCFVSLFIFISSFLGPKGTGLNTNENFLLRRGLQRILNALVFKDVNHQAQSEQNLEESLTNLRNYTASEIMNLANACPQLLLPYFDKLYQHVKKISCYPQAPLSRMESLKLIEALIVISNNFDEQELRTDFIYDIIQDNIEQWRIISNYYKSALDFITFIGLDQRPKEFSRTDPNKFNRQCILENLYTIVTIAKRCKWPKISNKLQKMDFSIVCSYASSVMCKNRTTHCLVIMLPQVLALIKILNQLFLPESLKALAPTYKNIHQECEMEYLLDDVRSATDLFDLTNIKTENCLTSMQSYLLELITGCYQILGATGLTRDQEIYCVYDIANMITSNVFCCLAHLPNHRIRLMIQVFLKPFVSHCPPFGYTLIMVPIFMHLAPIMLHRLKQCWNECHKSEISDEKQKIIHEEVKRLLIREYIGLLNIALLDIAEDNEPYNAEKAIPVELSILGKKLTQESKIRDSIFCTLQLAVYWNDTKIISKTIKLFLSVLHCSSFTYKINGSKASEAFSAILGAFPIHKQNEENHAAMITLGLEFYKNFRPKCPILSEMLQAIRYVDKTKVKSLDCNVTGSKNDPTKVDNESRELFKTITQFLTKKKYPRAY